MTTGWDGKTDSTFTSNYATWKLKIKTPAAGGPYSIIVETKNSRIELTDVLIGEVWVCSGQSNMEWNYYNGLQDIRDELSTCANPNIRFFQVPKSASEYPEDVGGSWRACDSASLKSFSAVGYFFGKKLNQELNVPIGLINSSWGGTPAEVWTPAAVVQQNTELKTAANRLRPSSAWPSMPGVVYNAMIFPITQFNVAGVIWYQGESNTGTNDTYQLLFTKMIDAWRSAWKKEFPFYYVQLAPFAYGNKNIGALLQEAQTKSLSHPKTGMVVITDLVDDVNDIHPVNKHDVGYRLANLALVDTYSKPVASFRSPQFKEAVSDKKKIELTFDYAPNGFMVKGKSAEGFFISGDNDQWFPAVAKIDGSKIIVSCREVSEPKYVRFGFANTIIGNVFSKEGLPLCPFRTDSFIVDQGPVK